MRDECVQRLSVARVVGNACRVRESEEAVKDGDAIDLAEDDFRRARRYLAPWNFAWPGDDDRTTTYPPPSDLVSREAWDGVMDLPTDVALKSSSYHGSVVARLYELHSQWIFSWPETGEAPYVEEAALLAGEEFDALVFNALHGWYRQALGCLRNAFETLAVASALAATQNEKHFHEWRDGTREITFGRARLLLRDSPAGQQIDTEAAPHSIFGDSPTAWVKNRYARLCGYAHSRAGHTNVDFWQSNGPVYVPEALTVVEAEFRETLALCYLLLRLGWPGYATGSGEPALLATPGDEWDRYTPVLCRWLLVHQP